MSDFVLQEESMLWLLPLVAVFIVVFRIRMARRKQDMQAFGEHAAWRGAEHHSMELWRLVLLLLAVVMVIVALARPAVNPHPKMIQREGRDVIFLLDVSKSMLAEDRLPNRLQSAKSAIAECVRDMDDHRMGLVVFAGSSSIVCPLTVDKDFFLTSLEKAGPASVAHGGTRFGDALLKVCDKLFSDSDQGYKDIILLTDGGDQSASLEKAIETVNEKQVKLIAIGLGDEKHGARIPLAGEDSDYMVYKNQEVWTKLDSAQLSNIIKQCDQGAFLAVGTRQMKLADIYQRISAQEKTQQLAEESVITYDEIFQVFIAASLVLLIAMVMIPHTWTKRARPAVVTAVVSLLFVFSSGVFASTAADGAYASGNYQEALALYEKQTYDTDDARVWYKRGNTEYRLMMYQQAVSSYGSAMQLSPDEGLLRDITYNLGNAYFKQAKSADDMYAALSLVNQSVAMYRRVILQYPEDRDAAVNLELAKIERRNLQKDIAADEARRREMLESLTKLREMLEAAVKAQSQTLRQTDSALMEDTISYEKRNGLRLKEKAVFELTKEAVELAHSTNKKFFNDLPEEVSPMAAAQASLATATIRETAAINYLTHHPHDAYSEEELALQSLRDALQALPQDPEDADQQAGEGEEGDEESDSDEGEGDDEGEDGDQESYGDGDMQSDMDPMDANKMDLESMDLPPPNDSPQDIIKQSAVRQQARQAEAGKKKGKPVEKDW